MYSKCLLIAYVLASGREKIWLRKPVLTRHSYLLLLMTFLVVLIWINPVEISTLKPDSMNNIRYDFIWEVSIRPWN
jgi:hypothetical protein